METFELRGDYIELNKLLKILGWVASGGQAKLIVQNGEILRNGAVETRVRAKLVAGDRIGWRDDVAIIAKPESDD